MRREDVMPFLGRFVKLEFSSGFVIDGEIVKVTDDAIFFETSETISAVSMNNIASIVLRERGGF